MCVPCWSMDLLSNNQYRTSPTIPHWDGNSCNACPSENPLWDLNSKVWSCVSCFSININLPLWVPNKKSCVPCPQNYKWSKITNECVPSSCYGRILSSDNKCGYNGAYCYKKDDVCLEDGYCHPNTAVSDGIIRTFREYDATYSLYDSGYKIWSKNVYYPINNGYGRAIVSTTGFEYCMYADDKSDGFGKVNTYCNSPGSMCYYPSRPDKVYEQGQCSKVVITNMFRMTD